MKTSFHPRALALSFLLAGLGLSGCGGAMNFPDAVSSRQVQGPAVRGSVFGGHAPIVGAHVYLVQPGTSGYGSPATSLLGAGGQTSASGYTITPNSSQLTPDPNVPGSAEYVTTDQHGAFNLTGGYSCTAGQPVYIYAYGGQSPANQPLTTSKNTFGNGTYAVQQFVVSNATTGKSGTATYTVTLTSASYFTAGETVTLANSAPVNGAQTVISSNLTPTQFAFVASNYSNGKNLANGTYADAGGTVSGYGAVGTAPTTSPIVELATLGVCPDNVTAPNGTSPGTGNFYSGSTALSFVYLNEISTVATAYTFQPFTLDSNNSAWDIGTSGTSQALLGINNAALTAAQLYSIQGNAQVSSTGDGEGHIANYQTQLNGVPNNGNGVIPQATIDTLGNILAACIDSSPGNGGVLSAQCTTLFNTATDGGKSLQSGDTAAADTATAILNIARYPAGNHSGTSGTVNDSYVADIYGIASATVPYAPYLNNAPDDWTLAINYPDSSLPGYPGATNGLVAGAQAIAIDGNGAVWFTGQTNYNVTRWSPLGAQEASNLLNNVPGFDISIDPFNNAWTGNGTPATTSGIYQASSNGVNYSDYGSAYISAHTVITDIAGDTFFAASTSSNSNSELFEYPVGSGPSSNPSQSTISPSVITAGNTVDHGSMDASGDLWITSESSGQIARVSTTGAALFTPPAGLAQPEIPAIDHAGNAWIAGQGSSASPYTAYIYLVSPTGAVTTLDSGKTAAALSATFGSAVDGNGNIWFDSRCGFNGTCSQALGVSTVFEINGATNTAISPPHNYIPEAQYGRNAGSTTLTPILNDAEGLAIDPSGNLWVANFTGNSIAEIIGAAAPVVTPLSVAAGKGVLGQKP